MQQRTSIWRFSAADDVEVTDVDQPWSLRYAMSRSAEGKECDELNQDFLQLVADEHRLAFAVCDGVSLSFCGQIAAQIVGTQMAERLFSKSEYTDRQSLICDEGTIASELKAWLGQLCKEGTKLVQAYELPAYMNPIVQDVLEEKRLKGSESAFVAGVIQKCQLSGDVMLMLCWQGDIRARLWLQDKEFPLRDASVVCTEERWSTRTGCVGSLHVKKYRWSAAQAEQAKLVVYSDGLALLDPIPHVASEAQLRSIMSETLSMANSDDMTYVEIHFEQPVQEEV